MSTSMANMCSNDWINEEVINNLINQPILRVNSNRLIPVIVYHSASDGTLPKYFQKLFPPENGSPPLQRGIRIDPLDSPAAIPKYIYPLGKVDSHSLLTPKCRKKRVKVKARLHPLSPSKYCKENRLPILPTKNGLNETQIGSSAFSSSSNFSVEGMASVREDNTNSCRSVNDQQSPGKENTDVSEDLAFTKEAYRDFEIQMSRLSKSSPKALEKKVDSDVFDDTHVSGRFFSGTSPIPDKKHLFSGSVNHLTEVIKIKAKSSQRYFTKNKRDMLLVREAYVHNNLSKSCMQNTNVEDKSLRLEAITSDSDLSHVEDSRFSESGSPEKVQISSLERLSEEISCTQLNSDSDKSVSPGSETKGRFKSYAKIASKDKFWAKKFQKLLDSESPEKVKMSSLERLKLNGEESSCTQQYSHSNNSAISVNEAKGCIKSHYKIASKDMFWAKKLRKITKASTRDEISKNAQLISETTTHALPNSLNSLSKSYSTDLNNSGPSGIEKDQMNETTRCANTSQNTVCDRSVNKSRRLTLLIKKGKNSEYICSVSEKTNLCCESENPAPTSEKTKLNDSSLNKTVNLSMEKQPIEDANCLENSASVEKDKLPLNSSDNEQEVQSHSSTQNTDLDSSNTEPITNIYNKPPDFAQMDMDVQMNTQLVTLNENKSPSLSSPSNDSLISSSVSHTPSKIKLKDVKVVLQRNTPLEYFITNNVNNMTYQNFLKSYNFPKEISIKEEVDLDTSWPCNNFVPLKEEMFHTSSDEDECNIDIKMEPLDDDFFTEFPDMPVSEENYGSKYQMSGSGDIFDSGDELTINAFEGFENVSSKFHHFNNSSMKRNPVRCSNRLKSISGLANKSPLGPQQMLKTPQLSFEAKSDRSEGIKNKKSISGLANKRTLRPQHILKTLQPSFEAKSDICKAIKKKKSISDLANMSPLGPQQILKTPQPSFAAKSNRCEGMKNKKFVKDVEQSRELRKRNPNTLSMESKVNSKMKDVQSLFECKSFQKYPLRSLSSRKLPESERPKNEVKESSRNKCCFCNFTSNVQSVVNRHIMSHRLSSNWCCSFCPYVTPFKTYLRAHVKSHIGQELFQCSECSYRCRRKRDLQTHTRKHNRAKYFFRSRKPYRCKICSFSGSAFEVMVSHALEHFITKF